MVGGSAPSGGVDISGVLGTLLGGGSTSGKALHQDGFVLGPFLAGGDERVAGGLAPGADVADKAGVGGGHFEGVAVVHGVDGLIDLDDRARALQADAVEGDLFDVRRHGEFLLFGDGLLQRRKLDDRDRFFMSCVVEAGAAGVDEDVLEAVVREGPGRVVGADADATEDHVGFVLVEFVHPVAEFSEGDLDGVRKLRDHPLRVFPDVQDDRVGGRLVEVPVRECHEAFKRVLCREAGHVDGVFRGGVRRSVSELEVGEVIDRGPQSERNTEGVDPLVDAFVADNLRAEDVAVHGCRLLDDQFDDHRQGTGVVARMVVLGDIDDFVVGPFFESCGDELLLVPTGGRGSVVKDLDDGTALRSGIQDVWLFALRGGGDVVRHDAALLVGGPRQRDHGPSAGVGVEYFDHIAHGEDVRVLGLHVVVDDDTAPLVEGQASVFRDAAVRANADGQDDELRFDGGAALQGRDDGVALVFEGGDRVAQLEADALVADLAVEHLRHLKVEGRHDLIRRLEDGDVDAGFFQVLRHLEADEPAADHDSCLDLLLIDHGAEQVRVRDGPEGVDAGRVDARDGRPQGRGTGREDQFVVSFVVVFVRVTVVDEDRFVHAVDRRDLVVGPDIHTEPVSHLLRRSDEQGVAGADDIADVVRQAAVGIGDIVASFEYDDLRGFIEPAQSGSTTGAAGHATDDDNFHGASSFFFGLTYYKS